jgi:hypothetical protein
MVSAQATVGGVPVTFRSLLTQTGSQNIANVTPLTDAVIIQSTGKSAALIEGSASTALASIDLAKLASTTKKFVASIANVLDQITPGTSATFNPFTTAFLADGEAAADKVNDLLQVNTTISSTGVSTDITDKSNSVGTVSIVDGVDASALSSLPTGLLSIKPKYLANLVASTNDALASESNFKGALFEALFDGQYLNGGLDKTAEINRFRTDGIALVGAKVSNPRILSCAVDNSLYLCRVSITVKTSRFEDKLNWVVKFYPNDNKFLYYGDQFKFKAELVTSLVKDTDRLGVETIKSQITFNINEYAANWDKYQKVTVTLQSGSSTPDKTFIFKLKTASCPGGAGTNYSGMPFDDGTNDCTWWTDFDSANQQSLKDINAKIKLGKYYAVFKAWKNADRSDTPDVAIVPITSPFLTTDTLGSDGYPRVNIIQGSGSSLPYLSIDNADDFVTFGSLCITSATWCDNQNPAPHTTRSMPNSSIKLPSKIQADAKDGWTSGERAAGYFIHVKDKAGRDIMVSRYNF